jgi:hypothetical protein
MPFIAVALSIGLAHAVVGQSEAPASEPPLDRMGASYWTGFFGEQRNEVVKRSSGPGDPEVREIRGIVIATDPRITGSSIDVRTEIRYPNREPGGRDIWVATASFRIENDDGAWVGSYSRWYGPTGRNEWHVLEGEGAYDGLTAVFRLYGDGDFEGVIVPGELPSVPSPTALGTE